ncbi:tetratricopeptide repeat protein [Thermomonas sp.]|uniref:tetratricopeptide repeat protein n=1 Tax=Thermomonas sp. TaxID=1971895 RepID=UPI0035B4CF1E
MIGRFIGELKRRNVPRAAILYIGSVWALAQGIAQLGPELGAPESATRWFLIAAAIGFPLWLAFSWRYEFTSHGLKLEGEVDDNAPDARKVKRRTDLIIIGVLAIAVVLLLTDRLVERTSPAQAVQVAQVGNSIAVLPFENQSSDKDQQYFSDGLSEGFIIALARIDGLRVINRKSSFEFRDSKEDSRAIAAKLGVSHLLEGSVRRVGDTVRVSATLTKAADGSTLWAASFDRPYKDLFALQDQITAQVATALKSRLQPATAPKAQSDRPPSGNLDAYNAYLEARSATKLEAAVEAYDHAIELDPDYALAYAWKGRMLIDTLSAGGLSGEQAEQAFAQADASIEQAMRLAPNQPQTRIARGQLLMLRDFNWHDAEAELKRAVELDPDDGDALFQLGVARASQGDLAQAVELTRKALQLNPRSADWYRWLVAYLMPLGRLDEAEQAIGKAIELQPQGIYNHHLLAIAKVLRKDPAGARKAAEAEPAGPWRDFALAFAAQAGPDRTVADASLQAVEQYAEGWAFQMAQVYAVRGEPDAMFDWLQRALKARDPGMQSLLYDALLLRYRDDPRYAALAKQAGLPWPPVAAKPAAAVAPPPKP